MMQFLEESPILSLVIIISYCLGLLCSASALLGSRTPQGATAWVMSLLTVPFLAVPLFLVFGRSKFEGYNTKRRLMDDKVYDQFKKLEAMITSLSPGSDEIRLINSTISADNQPGFTKGNSVRLLVDGEATFFSMLEEMEKARSYIVIQFYIFRDDQIGRKFAEVLIRKARAGVRVNFLNDEIGHELSKKLRNEMKEAGIKFGHFNRRRLKGKLQINFRNHRKVLVIDGRVGYVGGLNVGDEYLGRCKRWGPWRDTHVKFEGPSVIAAQLACAKDWYFSNEEHLEADWNIRHSEENSSMLVLHTGPADKKHTCLLAHLALINAATQRLWIANPYFVPPESIMDAILLAILRGVDVRIIIPSYSDAKSIMIASKIYQEVLIDHGAKIYRYKEGFMHQKVMIVDETFGSVGSVNFDCRSMFINFEVMAVAMDLPFIRDLNQMFEKDLARSCRVTKEEFFKRPIWGKIGSRAANLMSPIL